MDHTCHDFLKGNPSGARPPQGPSGAMKKHSLNMLFRIIVTNIVTNSDLVNNGVITGIVTNEY